MRYTVRPISDRTLFTGSAVPSRFTVTWSQCCEVLERELEHLDATDLIIEVDVDERAVRLDGQLRADAKARSNAVRIAFESNVGPLTYGTDEFIRPTWRREGMREDWQHNVYAIAKSLEALRMVDRYGVTRRGEQYTGFKAIGGGSAIASGPAEMTKRQAAELLERIAIGDEGADRERSVQVILDGRCDMARVVRDARGSVHPDRLGGDHSLAYEVDQAARVLGVAR